MADEQNEARERLLVLGEIAAEVAHELRNVLQLISSNTYLAQRDPAASAPILSKIERHARIAHSIVDDLMGLARGEPARTEPTRVGEIVLAARADLGDGAVVWEDEVEPISLRVRVHPGLATRLLHTLYDNAIGASAPRSPKVTTRAYVDGDWTVLEVHDDGPGVPEEIAARIFEPLVTGKSGGTGLGLALARRIAKAHGGTIVLKGKRGAGAGACFEIRLPLAAR